MATPMRAYVEIAARYHVDTRDEDAVDDFFATKVLALPASEREDIYQELLRRDGEVDSTVELRRQLSRNSDELLAELYAETMGLSIAPHDPALASELARRWLRKTFARWKPAICGNEAVRSAFSLPEGERQIVLCEATLDVIAGAALGVTPVTVAVLLVKEGLIWLCKDCEGDP